MRFGEIQNHIAIKLKVIALPMIAHCSLRYNEKVVPSEIPTGINIVRDKIEVNHVVMTKHQYKMLSMLHIPRLSAP